GFGDRIEVGFFLDDFAGLGIVRGIGFVTTSFASIFGRFLGFRVGLVTTCRRFAHHALGRLFAQLGRRVVEIAGIPSGQPVNALWRLGRERALVAVMATHAAGETAAPLV